MQPQPNLPSILPSVALIINLSQTEENVPIYEQSQVLAAQLRDLGLSVTWVIDAARQTDCLARGQLATNTQEVAFTAAARSPQRLRRELAARQAVVQAASGHLVSVIVGDPSQLRARTAILAELGIRGVIARSRATAVASPPRLLSCGVWQLDAALVLPQTRRRWSLIPKRRLTAERLLTMGTVSQPLIVEIDCGQLRAVEMPNCVRLLQDVAAAVRQQQLVVATVSEVIGELASRHQVRPQRSILRQAA